VVTEEDVDDFEENRRGEEESGEEVESEDNTIAVIYL
jgi:hypothetical protein